MGSERTGQTGRLVGAVTHRAVGQSEAHDGFAIGKLDPDLDVAPVFRSIPLAVASADCVRYFLREHLTPVTPPVGIFSLNDDAIADCTSSISRGHTPFGGNALFEGPVFDAPLEAVEVFLVAREWQNVELVVSVFYCQESGQVDTFGVGSESDEVRIANGTKDEVGRIELGAKLATSDFPESLESDGVERVYSHVRIRAMW